MRRRSTAGSPEANDRTDRSGAEHRRAGVEEETSSWTDTWGEREEERVARWLTSKALSTSSGGGQGDSWALAGDVFQAPRVSVRPTVPERGGGQTEAMGADARAVVEAQVGYLQDERRRLAAALDADRAEADRVRRDQLMARSVLEAEIAGLDEDRRRASANAEAARLAAEHALRDEREARAAMEVAHVEAKRAEAEHFELWVALQVEVGALRSQRRRLRALRRRHRSA